MPKTNTHILIANKAMEKLAPGPRAVVFSHMQHYYLGSVFPDVLWFEHDCREVAQRVHGLHGENTANVVFDLLDKCSNDIQLAFILGYVTHMAADIILHPMIISKTAKHHLLEMQIDKIVNKSFYAHKVVYAHLLDDIDIGAFQLPKGKVKKALKLMLAVNKRLDSHFFYMLAGIAARFSKVDRGAFYMAPGKVPNLDSYKDPLTGKIVKKNLDRLMDDAVKLSVRMMQSAFDYSRKVISKRNCERIISGKSLYSGKEGVPKSKLKVFG